MWILKACPLLLAAKLWACLAARFTLRLIRIQRLSSLLLECGQQELLTQLGGMKF